MTKKFDEVVQWIYEDIVVSRKAPGLLVGLSGTDSIVAFLAAYKALEKAGKQSRLMGVHFAPSEDFIYDTPGAEIYLWFCNEVVPWLRAVAPYATVAVDTSIDWRCDGLRWGRLADMSMVSDNGRRSIRAPEDQYWVMGTRNRTEDVLRNYSNASTIASLQPIIGLFKSDILDISTELSVPQVAINMSCQADCICGRDQLGAAYVREIDIILHGQDNHKIPIGLRLTLEKLVRDKIDKNRFKDEIPYRPV